MKHTVTGKQHNSKMCFVCGLKNIAGLKASFYETDTRTLVALLTPRDEHQSYPGRLHGGIASAILDETIGRAINVGSSADTWGVTLELALTYRKPIPLGVELRVVGRITEEKSRSYTGTGEILLPDGEVAVAAVGKYLKAPLEKIADFDPVVNEWTIVRRDDDPGHFDI
ncbi:MAG TPA: PaaI family thioesterase [Geobacteraceae bacterium]|nr:PaaI family thioesterase [Geobacteraceae bacterium]